MCHLCLDGGHVPCHTYWWWQEPWCGDRSVLHWQSSILHHRYRSHLSCQLRLPDGSWGNRPPRWNHPLVLQAIPCDVDNRRSHHSRTHRKLMSHNLFPRAYGHEAPKSAPWHRRKDDRRWWRHISLLDYSLQENKDHRPYRSENGCGTSLSVSSLRFLLSRPTLPEQWSNLCFATLRLRPVCRRQLRRVRCSFRQ